MQAIQQEALDAVTHFAAELAAIRERLEEAVWLAAEEGCALRSVGQAAGISTMTALRICQKVEGEQVRAGAYKSRGESIDEQRRRNV